MKHARDDYDRIQDPAGKIPLDEPVFLIRAQDAVGPQAVMLWAVLARSFGASPDIIGAALSQAERMSNWQALHGSKVPDL